MRVLSGDAGRAGMYADGRIGYCAGTFQETHSRRRGQSVSTPLSCRLLFFYSAVSRGLDDGGVPHTPEI